ncbi:MAG: deaminase [Chloroflexi bacterium]|nr:deaminase [Chloroflexota bacterium]
MHRPKVVIQQQASVDGRLTIAPEVLLLFGDERWPEDGPDPVGVWIRATHQPQATLEGSGSFVLDGTEPEPLPPFEGDPTPLYDDFLPEHVIHRPDLQGWFTVVDGRGRVRWLYKEWPDPAWTGWLLLVLVGHHTPPAYLAYLRREDIPYLVAGEGDHVDLGVALGKMAARLGVACVLSTAGGRLNGALLRAGLVDEINITFEPLVIGGTDTPSLFDAPALQPGEWSSRLRLIKAQAQPGGAVWLRYAVG